MNTASAMLLSITGTTDLCPGFLILPSSIEIGSWRCVNNVWWIFWINVKYRCVFTVAFITYTAMFVVHQPPTDIIHSRTPIRYNWQTLPSLHSMAKLRNLWRFVRTVSKCMDSTAYIIGSLLCFHCKNAPCSPRIKL
jgi:hypothetical protein